MAITWFNENTNKVKNSLVTISDTTITLNKYACDFFDSAYSVMLGIDYEENMFFIKPLSKDLATRGDIPEDHQYKISVKPSYGRIANADFIREIKNILKVDSLKENPKKFRCEWNSKDSLMEINLKREEK